MPEPDENPERTFKAGGYVPGSVRITGTYADVKRAMRAGHVLSADVARALLVKSQEKGCAE